MSPPVVHLCPARTCVLIFMNTDVSLVIIKLHSWLWSLIIFDYISMLSDAQHGRRRRGTGSCRREREREKQQFNIKFRRFLFSSGSAWAWNKTLPGWLTGDSWVVLVGRVGWDLNRSLSSVDTGVRKWFWFHPSCYGSTAGKWWYELFKQV